MSLVTPAPGQHVITRPRRSRPAIATPGIDVDPIYLDARKVARGVIEDAMEGNPDGGMWLVRHDDGSVGAYTIDEMEEIKELGAADIPQS